MSESKKPHVFTSGDISRFCHVAPRTASKWIDSGILPGYKIPGSGDRRVLAHDFYGFLRENNLHSFMPFSFFVFFLGMDRGLFGGFAASMQGRAIFCESVFDIGFRASSNPPAAVVVDVAMGSITARSLASTIKCHEAGKGVQLFAYGPDSTAGLEPFDGCLPCRDSVEENAARLMNHPCMAVASSRSRIADIISKR